MTTYLLIIGDREGLRWVIRNRRMAFRSQRAGDAHKLAIGDELLLYTTRGCFKNPGRDRGRVVGRASVLTAVRAEDQSIELAGRSFALTCDLELETLARKGVGVVLADLVDRLQVFPDTGSWSAWMRRPLLRLPAGDAKLLRQALDPLAGPPTLAAGTYDPPGTYDQAVR